MTVSAVFRRCSWSCEQVAFAFGSSTSPSLSCWMDAPETRPRLRVAFVCAASAASVHSPCLVLVCSRAREGRATNLGGKTSRSLSGLAGVKDYHHFLVRIFNSMSTKAVYLLVDECGTLKFSICQRSPKTSRLNFGRHLVQPRHFLTAG